MAQRRESQIAAKRSTDRPNRELTSRGQDVRNQQKGFSSQIRELRKDVGKTRKKFATERIEFNTEQNLNKRKRAIKKRNAPERTAIKGLKKFRDAGRILKSGAKGTVLGLAAGAAEPHVERAGEALAHKVTGTAFKAFDEHKRKKQVKQIRKRIGLK